MAKVISYEFLSNTVNRGTEENPVIEQTTKEKRIICPTQAIFDANYPIAEKEAIPGSIEVTGEFDPEPAPAGDPVTWDELNNAYQEGVDSV